LVFECTIYALVFTVARTCHGIRIITYGRNFTTKYGLISLQNKFTHSQSKFFSRQFFFCILEKEIFLSKKKFWREKNYFAKKCFNLAKKVRQNHHHLHLKLCRKFKPPSNIFTRELEFFGRRNLLSIFLSHLKGKKIFIAMPNLISVGILWKILFFEFFK
jgi:hypothetical protein